MRCHEKTTLRKSRRPRKIYTSVALFRRLTTDLGISRRDHWLQCRVHKNHHDVLSFELEQLIIPVQERFGLPEDQRSKLSELALVDARSVVQMELKRLRSRGVKLFRQQGHIPISEFEALRRCTTRQ